MSFMMETDELTVNEALQRSPELNCLVCANGVCGGCGVCRAWRAWHACMCGVRGVDGMDGVCVCVCARGMG